MVNYSISATSLLAITSGIATVHATNQQQNNLRPSKQQDTSTTQEEQQRKLITLRYGDTEDEEYHGPSAGMIRLILLNQLQMLDMINGHLMVGRRNILVVVVVVGVVMDGVIRRRSIMMVAGSVIRICSNVGILINHFIQ